MSAASCTQCNAFVRKWLIAKDRDSKRIKGSGVVNKIELGTGTEKII